MTAATAASTRPRTPLATRAVPRGALRLLRVELRRNALLWILPLIAALFWFDSYRPSVGTSPLFGIRTFWNMGEGHTIIDFGPFVAGVSAWMGSRDGRRGLADLVTATSRPRWAVQLTTWAATAIWAVIGYLVFVGVMFAMYARQGVTGSPPWWSVAVGATAVLAFSAFGFAIGAYWPSRFAAAVAAFGGFLAMALSSRAGFGAQTGWGLLLPTNSNNNFDGNAQNDSGIFYHWLPDLPIARIIFLAGIALFLLALTGLPARAGGPWVRRAAAVLVLAGVAVAGTAIGLVNTAKIGPRGVVISALHEASNDVPIAYTPVCGHADGLPVCLNPAYQRWLPNVTTGLAPALAAVTGLPGAPARVTQVPASYPSGHGGPPSVMTLGSQPPVLRVALGMLNLPGPCGFCGGPVAAKVFADQLRLSFVQAFVGTGSFRPGSPAQQIVQAVLLRRAGVPFAAQPALLTTVKNGPAALSPPATGSIYAAARRFAAQPTAAQQNWLTAHLAALRTGRLSLRELP